MGKESQESEEGMWDVGRGKDSAHMRDHRNDDHDDHGMMMTIVLSVAWARRCVLPCEKLPRFLRLLFVLFPL